MFRPTVHLIAIAALCLPTVVRADDETLPESLKKRAPALIAAVKKKGYTNVGVLKFLTRHADGPLRDDSGELNTTLANRTQVALVLANQDEEFGILDKPGDFVAKNQLLDANHTTPAGRKAFFDAKFPMAWSKDKVTPSGFIVGTITFAADLKTARIELQTFDRTGQLEPLLEPWSVSPDAQMIGESGHSYTLPPVKRKSLISGGPITPQDVQSEAAEAISVTKPEPTRPPEAKPFAPLANSPVKWVVRYNDIPVEVSGNTVPEPKETDKVSFALVNESTETYAAVLLVNGENTLYQERLSPFVCRKWILEPRMEAVISGFQTEGQKAIPFAVTKPDDPMPDEIRYGDNTGTFRLVIYAGTISDTPVTGGQSADERLAIAHARGNTRPAGIKPQSLKALQAELMQQSKDATNSRGLVIKGSGTEKSETVQTHFAPASEQPVADISLRYYTPKK